MIQGMLQWIPNWQYEKMNRLRQEKPTHIQADVECPDCGAPMKLRLGRYGRFYGCTKFKRTGCKGAHSAHDDGRLMGTVANKTVRKARRQVMVVCEGLRSGALTLPRDVDNPTHVGQWGLKRCNEFLVLVGRKPVLPQTSWERLDSLLISTE